MSVQKAVSSEGALSAELLRRYEGYLILNRRQAQKRRPQNSHGHERDVALIESIIEPTARSKDLFSISKRAETQAATENGEHRGVIQQDLNESILIMCKCESDNTETHNNDDILMTGNWDLQGLIRPLLICSLRIHFAPHAQQSNSKDSFWPKLIENNESPE